MLGRKLFMEYISWLIPGDCNSYVSHATLRHSRIAFWGKLLNVNIAKCQKPATFLSDRTLQLRRPYSPLCFPEITKLHPVSCV